MADWKDLYECPECGDIFENEEDARRCCGTGERPIHRYRRLTPATPDRAITSDRDETITVPIRYGDETFT